MRYAILLLLAIITLAIGQGLTMRSGAFLGANTPVAASSSLLNGLLAYWALEEQTPIYYPILKQ
jgi:hypothetical protein